MSILIDRVAGTVAIGGVSRTVDLSSMDPAIDSVTYDDVSGAGYTNTGIYFGRQVFSQLYAKYIQAWKVAGAPTRTLAEVKADQRIQINSIRDSIEQSGFPYDVGGTTYQFDSNPISSQRISLAALAARDAIASGTDGSFNIDWTTKDNQSVALNASQLAKMPTALATYAAVLHSIANTRKAAIDAATTVAEVLAITWDE